MNFCECTTDGYCPRYGREMRGRFRGICQGVDVDLGTAAAFRRQWASEVQPRRANVAPVKLILQTDQAPGDAVAMTAAVYSLHRSHPGRYLTAVESPWQEVFVHNPDVTAATDDAHPLRMHYSTIRDSNQRAVHFMQGWCEHLEDALGVPVPLLTNRPHIYFDAPPPAEEAFWVVCSGGKSDFTNKLWPGYQETVDLLPEVRFVQVGLDQAPLRGAENLVGKTTLRELFELVRRAKGVLCGVSLLMHVAAALGKPAVVVAGGREPVPWNAYPKQQYVHTVGALPCSDLLGHVGGACWRSRVVPLGDGRDDSLCERPVDGTPQCMRLITPERVAELLRVACSVPVPAATALPRDLGDIDLISPSGL